MGALRGAILGDVAAAPKMAGLAHEVSCIMVLCRVPVVGGGVSSGQEVGGDGRVRGKKSFPFPPQSHMASPFSLLSSASAN